MDCSGCLGVDVAGKAPRSGKLGDKILKAFSIPAVLRIESFKRPFKPQGGKNGRGTMAWAGNVDHVYIMLAYQVVEVRVDKDQSGTSSPMAYIQRVTRFPIL